jgi:ferredoxin-NADP reductase
VRSYSLSGAPTDALYRIGVKVEARGAAGHLLRTGVRVGDRLEVGAPRGSFILDEGERPVVLASAGIGVTPVLAMLHALHDRRSTRAIWWVHGARNRTEHAFADEAMMLLADLGDAHRRIYYSQPAPTDRAETDYDAVGRVTPQALQAAGVPLDGEYYLCGPTAFMDSMRDGLLGFGVPPEHVHIEIFGAHDALTPGVLAHATRPPHPPDGTPGTGPLVTFVRSGLEVQWRDDAANLLELAETCDVPVRWSCRTGVCHTCETGLLEGAVDYDPEPLEAPAEGNILLCCARPTADLTIDV